MDLIDRAELEKELQNSCSDCSDATHIVWDMPTVEAIPLSVIDEIEKALIENVDRIENDDLRIAVAIFISEALDDIREIVKEYTDAK